jgi:hypothetical protein
MARPHCPQHKRYYPYCDACKALVAKAKEEAERQEASEALEADVGFAVETPETTEADKRIAELEAQTPESVEAEAEEEPLGDSPFPLQEKDERQAEEEEKPAVPVGGMFPPDIGPTLDTGDQQPPEAGVPPADLPTGDIDETEAAMAKDGEFDIEPPPGQVSDAEAAGHPPCPKPQVDDRGPGAVYEDGQKAGRKEVIAAVREYFSDGIDTVAFKLLEWLAEKYK